MDTFRGDFYQRNPQATMPINPNVPVKRINKRYFSAFLGAEEHFEIMFIPPLLFSS